MATVHFSHLNFNFQLTALTSDHHVAVTDDSPRASLSFSHSLHPLLLHLNFPLSPSTMICSIRTGKSGSEWLDRLRSSKGIPTGDDIDLDSFLRTAHSHSPQPRPRNPPRHRPHPSETRDPPLSAILAQLFNTGTALTLTSKKCPRKQTNPKIFLAHSSSTSTAAADSPVAAPSGDVAVEEEQPAAVNRGGGGEEENGDDDGGDELKGFTRSEVTVIDTSCPRWKVDKLVFRKKNVWKVRERKPKNKSSVKKKRKGVHEVDDINGTEIRRWIPSNFLL
ncbi:uncharacterized protein LOC130746235 isoform X2 [Lotus japonicus]|uniref:uncharacterized protein LOC130746235 isoform X2 n=1 Tax=Lotus japonicus TaxID=34305 RepID=UPI0025858723|nr:uncharacterized protein LOC130746235 isoform X2 [Lotus japonicus]